MKRKNIKLTERQSLRFTTDFFNIWNQANFANRSIDDVEAITHDHLGNPASDGPSGRFSLLLGRRG